MCAALCVPRLVSAQTPTPVPPPAPAPAAVEAAPIPGTARLDGRILRADGKTPDAGALLRICSLDSQVPTGSATANGKGEFELTGLSHGLLELVVTSGDQLYAGNQVVQLAPAEHKTLELILVPTPGTPERSTGKTPHPSPCSDRPPTGSAEIRARSATSQFLHSKKGIATVAGAGAAVLLLLTAGGGDDDEPAASPITP
jgi:hypothetical protein